MRRGEVWTFAGDKDYAGKPRPVVIVQDDSFDATDSTTICAFTTDPTDAPLFRLVVEPNERNGLHSICRLMVDWTTTVPKAMGTRIGRLKGEGMVRINQAMTVFLGMAVSARPRRGATARVDYPHPAPPASSINGRTDRLRRQHPPDHFFLGWLASRATRGGALATARGYPRT